MPTRIEFGIVCDDARREDSGKLIFIGVYANNIVVPSFPAVLVLCFVIGVHVDVTTETNAKIRVILNDKELYGGNGKMTASLPGRHLFPLKNVLVELEQSGMLRFEMSVEDGDWQTVCEMPVGTHPISASST
jgi:hypothetical protein